MGFILCSSPIIVSFFSATSCVSRLSMCNFFHAIIVIFTVFYRINLLHIFFIISTYSMGTRPGTRYDISSWRLLHQENCMFPWYKNAHQVARCCYLTFLWPPTAWTLHQVKTGTAIKSITKSFGFVLPLHPPGWAHRPSVTPGAPLGAPKRPKIPSR